MTGGSKIEIGNFAGAPEWRTPVISEDSIADSTRTYFSPAIDNYEPTNPVQYGS